MDGQNLKKNPSPCHLTYNVGPFTSSTRFFTDQKLKLAYTRTSQKKLRYVVFVLTTNSKSSCRKKWQFYYTKMFAAKENKNISFRKYMLHFDLEIEPPERLTNIQQRI
jgi:hypothetical protein